MVLDEMTFIMQTKVLIKKKRKPKKGGREKRKEEEGSEERVREDRESRAPKLILLMDTIPIDRARSIRRQLAAASLMLMAFQSICFQSVNCTPGDSLSIDPKPENSALCVSWTGDT